MQNKCYLFLYLLYILYIRLYYLIYLYYLLKIWTFDVFRSDKVTLPLFFPVSASGLAPICAGSGPGLSKSNFDQFNLIILIFIKRALNSVTDSKDVS